MALAVVACVACRGDVEETTEPARWTLGAEELRIGSLDDPEDALTEVPHLFVTPWNELLVAQPVDATVRVHDARGGRLLRRIGRAGEGPGEFRLPNWIGLVGDTLWVHDARIGRISFFDRAGDHLADRSYPAAPTLEAPLIARFGMLTVDGGALFVSASRDRDQALPVLVVHPDGTRSAIGELSGLPQFAGTSSADGSFSFQSQRFWNRTLWSPDPQGRNVVFAERHAPETPARATYRLTRVTVAGDTLFSRYVEYEPVPVPQSILDSLPAGTPDEYAPEHYPPVSAVVAGRDGTTWVGREATNSTVRRWDVFDASGEQMGVLDAPAGLEIHDASASRIWAVQPGEYDEPYVVRLPVLGGDQDRER